MKIKHVNISIIIRILAVLVIISSVSTVLADNSATTLSATIGSKLWFNVADSAISLTLDPTLTAATVSGDLQAKANKAGWTIATHSSDDSGKLKSGSTYLYNTLGVSASSITGGTGHTITPPLATSGQTLLTGTANTQGQQTSSVTYSQLADWRDDASLTYQIVITFVGTPG